MWGAWARWCRAGWACSWCAVRRGGCGIIREDRAFGEDQVRRAQRVVATLPVGDPFPPGARMLPAGPFLPDVWEVPGREGAWGRKGREEQGRQGRRSGVRGRGGRLAGRGRPAVPAATGHTVTVAWITRRRTELAGPLGDLSKTPLVGRAPPRPGTGPGAAGPRSLARPQEARRARWYPAAGRKPRSRVGFPADGGCRASVPAHASGRAHALLWPAACGRPGPGPDRNGGPLMPRGRQRWTIDVAGRRGREAGSGSGAGARGSRGSRARWPGPAWDLGNTALPARLPYPEAS